MHLETIQEFPLGVLVDVQPLKVNDRIDQDQQDRRRGRQAGQAVTNTFFTHAELSPFNIALHGDEIAGIK